jgi:hypothetical protein
MLALVFVRLVTWVPPYYPARWFLTQLLLLLSHASTSTHQHYATQLISMALLDLPNEILHMVIAESRPEGFEAFVLSCKRVHQVADSLIRQHNQLKQDFSSLREISFGNDPDSFNPIRTLFTIVDHPLIAKYIQSLEYSDLSDELFDMDFGLEVFENESENENILPLLERSKHIQHSAQCALDYDHPPSNREIACERFEDPVNQHMSKWRSLILKGRRAAALGVLLGLLPNLRQLTLTEFSVPGGWYIHPSIKALTADNTNTNILAKLDTVEIHYEFDGVSLEELYPYLLLPSIKRIKATGIAPRDLRSDSSWANPWLTSHTSVLEELVLEDADAEATTIAWFLAPLTHLRTFVWNYRCTRESLWKSCHWDGESFANAVARAAGEQIQDMTLTINYEHASFTAIKTFKHFTALKRLTLDVQLLLGESNFVHAERVTGHGWLPPRSSLRKKYDLPRLSDMLPPTLQSLRLLVSDHVHEPERLFEQATWPPLLRKIAIGSHARESISSEPFDRIAEDLASSGIQLYVSDCHLLYPLPISYIPYVFSA